MQAKPLAAVAGALAILLAGCTAQLTARQTEPFRIQIEGAPQVLQVAEGDSAPKEVVVENTRQAESINVEVQVKQVSTQVTKVLIIIKDRDSGEELERRVLETSGEMGTETSGTGGTPSGNQTTSGGTAGGTMQGQIIVQNFFVDVKGKNNIVVITQAQQGQAEVNIAAHAAGTTQGGGDTTTSTMTSTVTATGTASTNTTTTDTGTGGP